MPIIARDSGGGEDFEPIPEDMHHVVCVSVVDIGTQPQGKSPFPSRRKVLIQWEFPELMVEYEKDGVKEKNTRVLGERYTLSLSSKANLRHDLDAWRGVPFTEDDLQGWDLKNVLGANGLMTVMHEERNGKVYANMKAITRLHKSMSKVEPFRPRLYFTINDVPKSATSVPWPSIMPEWMRSLVMQSAEYQERFGGYDPGNGEPPPPDDDDIPF